jgi:hypothetical protein
VSRYAVGDRVILDDQVGEVAALAEVFGADGVIVALDGGGSVLAGARECEPERDCDPDTDTEDGCHEWPGGA